MASRLALGATSAGKRLLLAAEGGAPRPASGEATAEGKAAEATERSLRRLLRDEREARRAVEAEAKRLMFVVAKMHAARAVRM